MRHLTATLCLTIAVLLGSVGVSSALPKCEGSPRTISYYGEVRLWSNCAGTIALGSGGGRRAGNKYVGEWKSVKINGQGTYTYADGRKYVGEWRNFKQRGQGIQYHADGTVENKGLWRNAKFLRTNVSVSPGTNKAIGGLSNFYKPYHFLDLCKGSNLTSASVMKSVQKDINSSANSFFEKYKIPKKEHDKIKDISWDESLNEFNEDSINKLLMASGFGKPMGLSRKQQRVLKKNCSEMVALIRIMASKLQGSNQGKKGKRKF